MSDLRGHCIEAAVAAVGKIDYADREIIALVFDTVAPMILADALTEWRAVDDDVFASAEAAARRKIDSDPAMYHVDCKWAAGYERAKAEDRDIEQIAYERGVVAERKWQDGTGPRVILEHEANAALERAAEMERRYDEVTLALRDLRERFHVTEYPNGKIQTLIVDGTNWVSVASANAQESRGETKVREQVAERIESEFADDPWIFNQIRDEAERQLATHIKDMAIRVARGEETP